ncbi:MAG: general secretion pathway protein GspK [Bryobacteraceae bacterium]|nr:general secretion pathway protein GspK [Bryobacteraceae bacterium]
MRMRSISSSKGPGRRGSALLAVLWLTAALSAIAFSVATTVRGETERAAASLDGLRGHYLATGAIDRAILYMMWGPGERRPDGLPEFWDIGVSRLYFSFPSGDAVVEIVPAASRLNLNAANEEDLFRLLLAIGAEPAQAREIAAGIVDWRTPSQGPSFFDRYYLSMTPSFRARHASFEEVEEVLLIRGMTPELFYGSYIRDPEGRLVRRSGLRDCVAPYGATNLFDVNAADPALLLSLGIYPGAVAQIVERRRVVPFRSMNELEPFRKFAGPGAQKLGIGGISIYTLRATARHRLEDGRLAEGRRSVAATVKYFGPQVTPPYQVLRWHDNAAGDSSEWWQ